MNKIFEHKDNTENHSKYRILQNQIDGYNVFVEIEIDLNRQTFKVKRRKYTSFDKLEWQEQIEQKKPNELLNNFLNSNYPKSIEWDYLPGLDKKGKITPQMLVKWAYLQNGYFWDQDEDLAMYKAELIETMHDLMIDKYSNRKLDLFKILKNYSKEVFEYGKDNEAMRIFGELKNIRSDEIYHIELMKHIEDVKRTS